LEFPPRLAVYTSLRDQEFRTAAEWALDSPAYLSKSRVVQQQVVALLRAYEEEENAKNESQEIEIVWRFYSAEKEYRQMWERIKRAYRGRRRAMTDYCISDGKDDAIEILSPVVRKGIEEIYFRYRQVFHAVLSGTDLGNRFDDVDSDLVVTYNLECFRDTYEMVRLKADSIKFSSKGDNYRRHKLQKHNMEMVSPLSLLVSMLQVFPSSRNSNEVSFKKMHKLVSRCLRVQLFILFTFLI